MKIFINSNNIEEVTKLKELSIIDGIYINHIQLLKNGAINTEEIYKYYLNISSVLENGDIFIEIFSTDYEYITKEAKILAELGNNIIINIPYSIDGIKAISHLSNEEIRACCFSIFSPIQALMATKAGALYISIPLKFKNYDYDGFLLLKQMMSIKQYYDVELIVDSIDSSTDIFRCFDIGADAAIISTDIIKELFNNPLTEIKIKNNSL